MHWYLYFVKKVKEYSWVRSVGSHRTYSISIRVTSIWWEEPGQYSYFKFTTDRGISLRRVRVEWSMASVAFVRSSKRHNLARKMDIWFRVNFFDPPNYGTQKNRKGKRERKTKQQQCPS